MCNQHRNSGNSLGHTFCLITHSHVFVLCVVYTVESLLSEIPIYYCFALGDER